MPQYLINPLITTESVHFCAGPSGAGKTRWLLTTLHNIWRRGKDVLGHRSYPVPWVYVPMDRMYSSVEATLLSLDIDPLDIKVIPAVDLAYDSINPILDDAKGMGAKLIVIEMFAYLLKGQHNNDSVRQFMGAVQRALYDTGVTIIGTMPAPKMTPKDRYKDPRQRISGPAAWGHCGETIFLVERDPKLPENSPERIIQVMPRNADHEIFRARFHKNGHLILDRSRAVRLALDDA